MKASFQRSSLFIFVILLSSVCSERTYASESSQWTNVLCAFEDALAQTDLIPCRSPVWLFLFQQHTNENHFFTLQKFTELLSRTKESHLDALVKECRHIHPSLHKAIVLGLREIYGTFQQASEAWAKAVDQGRERIFLSRLLDFPRAVIPLLDWIHEENLRVEQDRSFVQGSWLQVIREATLKEIGCSMKGMRWYFQCLNEWTPLPMVWKETMEISLRREGEKFLKSVERATTMGDSFHRELLRHCRSFKFQKSSEELALYWFHRIPAWNAFVWWTLTRAASEVADHTREALLNIDEKDRTDLSLLQSDDETWNQALHAALRNESTPFARWVCQAITDDDYCAIVWASLMAERDEDLGKVFDNWRKAHGEVTDFSSSHNQNDLVKFRKQFGEFARSRLGWKLVANRLWIESAGPPGVLCDMLCRTFREEPQQFWILLGLSMAENPDLAKRLRKKIRDGMEKLKIPEMLLESIFTCEHVHSLLFPLLQDWLGSGDVRKEIEKLIVEKRYGSPIYTMLLAAKKNASDGEDIGMSTWDWEKTQHLFLNQCENIDGMRVVVDWIMQESVLRESWHTIVLEKGSCEPHLLRMWMEGMLSTMEASEKVAIFAYDFVRESALFEQLITSSTWKFSHVMREIAQKYQLEEWLP